MRDGGRGYEAIGGIGVQVFEPDGEHGYIARERQFGDARIEQFIPQLKGVAT